MLFIYQHISDFFIRAKLVHKHAETSGSKNVFIFGETILFIMCQRLGYGKDRTTVSVTFCHVFLRKVTSISLPQQIVMAKSLFIHYPFCPWIMQYWMLGILLINDSALLLPCLSHFCLASICCFPNSQSPSSRSFACPCISAWCSKYHSIS